MTRYGEVPRTDWARPIDRGFQVVLATTVDLLATQLQVGLPDLERLANAGPASYREWYQRKRCGGVRRIATPNQRLLDVQRQLPPLLAPMINSGIAFETQGRGHVRAARVHTGAEWVATLDVEDFFESLRADWLFEWLIRYGCSPTASRLICDLTTLRGSLPQGTASSPILATLLMARFDARVGRFAEDILVRVTRLTDDLTVSGSTRKLVEEGVRMIRAELARMGLREQTSKYTIGPGRSAIVHGLTITPKVGLSKAKRRHVRSQARRDARYGSTATQRASLSGHLGYLRQFHRVEERKLRSMLSGP